MDSSKLFAQIKVVGEDQLTVQNFFPTRYWPVIDDALRRAAFDRKVQVQLMASLWNHTRPDMKFYLKSLAALDGANDASIQVVCITYCTYFWRYVQRGGEGGCHWKFCWGCVTLTTRNLDCISDQTCYLLKGDLM